MLDTFVTRSAVTPTCSLGSYFGGKIEVLPEACGCGITRSFVEDSLCGMKTRSRFVVQPGREGRENLERDLILSHFVECERLSRSISSHADDLAHVVVL